MVTPDTEASKDVTCHQTYVDIANYLKSGTYPEGADKVQERSIRRRSEFFTMDAGHLQYIGGKVKQRPRLVQQSEEEQLRLIRTMHNTAHLVRDKMSQLNGRYYWPETI